MFGMVLGFGDVVVPFQSTQRLEPEKIRQLFKGNVDVAIFRDLIKYNVFNFRKRWILRKKHD